MTIDNNLVTNLITRKFNLTSLKIFLRKKKHTTKNEEFTQI